MIDTDATRRRFEALGRMLVDMGHLTPHGQRVLNKVIDEELGGDDAVGLGAGVTRPDPE